MAALYPKMQHHSWLRHKRLQACKKGLAYQWSYQLNLGPLMPRESLSKLQENHSLYYVVTKYLLRVFKLGCGVDRPDFLRLLTLCSAGSVRCICCSEPVRSAQIDMFRRKLLPKIIFPSWVGARHDSTLGNLQSNDRVDQVPFTLSVSLSGCVSKFLIWTSSDDKNWILGDKQDGNKIKKEQHTRSTNLASWLTDCLRLPDSGELRCAEAYLPCTMSFYPVPQFLQLFPNNWERRSFFRPILKHLESEEKMRGPLKEQSQDWTKGAQPQKKATPDPASKDTCAKNIYNSNASAGSVRGSAPHVSQRSQWWG